MSNELRDRIAKVVRSKVSGTRDETDEISQAIIDEFGLEVEAHPNKYLSDTRVVGEWEKHPNHTTHHLKCGCV